MTVSCDLLIRGGTLLPMTGDRESFAGDLLIREGCIAEVRRGEVDEVEAAEVLAADDCLVLPGFVQGHVHVVQTLLRHQADELELLDWLRLRTWPYEAALDGDGVEAAAELGAAELLSGGTTTAVDFGTTHDHDRVFAVAERLGIRFISGKTHMNVGDGAPPALLEDHDRSLADAEELGQRWHGSHGGRLSYAVAPRFALSCTRELLEGCVDLARSRGWLLQTHASENRDEVAAVRQLTGSSNIDYLADVGLCGEDVILAHGVHLSEAEVQILARTGTKICHCPGANLKLASGIADIPGLRAAGVPVMLGADGAPCNNRLSIFHEMSLAATIHSVRHGPTAMSAWHVLRMATVGGAEALGLDHVIGTLEPGKAADVAVVRMDDWPLLPAGNPASRLVYGATAAHVRHVVVDGKPVVVDHDLVGRGIAEGIQQRSRTAWSATAARMEEMR